MKVLGAVLAVGLALMGSASAQPYGDRDYGYRDRGERGDRYGGREYGGRDYADRDYEDRGRGRRDRGRDDGFDEREYLRCNADVRQAVQRGQMLSGAIHYQKFGRREGRRLSC